MSGHPVLPSEPITLPLLPLRDVVVFPHMVIPLFVGRPKSIKALEAAMEAGRQIMLVAQKAAGKDEPKPEDMFEIGCVSSILQMLKLPDGTVKVLVEGIQRARTVKIADEDEFFTGEVVRIEDASIVVQVYEDTTGLRPGIELRGDGQPLSIRLGPGLLGHIFDGLLRPLSGAGSNFVQPGMRAATAAS